MPTLIEIIPEEDASELSWPALVQALLEAIESALHAAGQAGVMDHGLPEFFIQEGSAHARLIRSVTWRVRALAEQLRPHGTINFSSLRSFSYTPTVCGLCGEKLRMSQHFVCMACAIALNLALGTISVSAWLRFLHSSEGSAGGNERAWIDLLSPTREDEHTQKE